MSMRSGFLTEILRHVGKGGVVVAGSIAVGASGTAPTVNKGKGFSVAYSATGVYTITLDKSFDACVSFVSSLRQGTPSATYQLCNGLFVAATSSAQAHIGIYSFATGSTASAVNDSTAIIDFVAVFKNTAAPG
jgi:hypothetical protein